MSQLHTLIKRHFTGALEQNSNLTVYDLFNWSKRDVLLKDHKSGRVLTDMKDLDFPEHYSQTACDIIASKYFRKAGVGSPEGYETSMRQVAHRMVNFWVEALVEEGILQNNEQKTIVYDELVYCFLNQMFAPNSPQWFNTGLKLSYGIQGGCSSLYYYDEKQGRVVMSEDDYTRTQASACFILSIEDKLLGAHSISEEYVTETKLFKGGSGTGTNFSSIRAEGEKLSGGGASSGLMSFLKGLDRNAGAIKSGGTTRRAAKMVCLDIDHPEIENFILWKATEEDKVRALAKMGYDADMDGEAYQTVSGQNSNNSVRLTDEFMQKVTGLDEEPESTQLLQGRIDQSINREVPVAELWQKFNEAAWRCADPAPQFTDTFNAWHTCPAGEDGLLGARHNSLNSTNPCGEYAFLDDTSCNLASINVLRFLDIETGRFDVESFVHMITLCQLVLEASIHWGQFPTEDIARKTWIFRTTGLGMANLASLLMASGLPYDSDEARAYAAALTGVLTGHSYYVSSLMSEVAGPFHVYELNREHMLRVLRNHARVAGAREDEFEGLSYEPLHVRHEILEELGQADLSAALKESWQQALSSGEVNGYRNAQVSVMAPTGTISFAMDCSATSIEPFFSHVVYKKLSGGGFMMLANPVISIGLRRLGYTEEQIRDIIDHIMREEDGQVIDGQIEDAPWLKPEHLAVFDTANQCGNGKRYIHFQGHVLMVAALTPLLSGAISKTVNLPNDATVEDFKTVHINAWKLGVKGITLYRDGSKFTQPLNRYLSQDHGALPLDELLYRDLLAKAESMQRKIVEQNKLINPPLSSRREKPVGIRTGRTHPAQIEDVKIYTTVNRGSNGEISEIYITTDREGTLIMGLLNSLSKTISVMLQYKIPPQNISKMLRGQKYEPYGFVTRHPYIKYCTSISDLISKVIDIEIGDYSRCQVKPEQPDLHPADELNAIAPVASKSEDAADNAIIDLEYRAGVQEDDDDEDDAPALAFPALREREYATGAQQEPGIDGLAHYPDGAKAKAQKGQAPMDSQIGLEDFIHENAKDAAQNGEKLYDGSTCPNCSSSRMVKNGTCKVCLDCGTTTGCS
ncbi:MAG: vitamin B12-dependent ribonucleotide reductase [Clostridiaceae bacterium]|nr:vitamin B12-dependent ribonucleotide reductase [Clostridiaceae bacterium]